MPKIIPIALLLAIAFRLPAQTDGIIKEITVNEVKAHMTFLASDELKGRDTGSPELAIAARYIASSFQQAGLKPAVGDTSYFQPVKLSLFTPPSGITFAVNGKTYNKSYKLGDDALLFGGGNAALDHDVVFAGYGSQRDLEKAAVKGKIVVAFVGSEDDGRPRLSEAEAKEKRARQLGAVALVEIIATPGIPFRVLAEYLNQERMIVAEDGGLPHLWMKNDPELVAGLKKKKTKGSLKIEGVKTTPVAERNVAGILEGGDPALKNEYIVISAHYDHVGIGAPNAAGDSIYNGARDNAIGTVGLMMTAKYLSQHRPGRSVLFLALTGEEKGLLGSAWYVAHPLVPLKKTVFNFNCDGAGYNDTTIATVIGLERTSAQPAIAKACEAFGLRAAGDPAPEQNLYDRSDNFNFAVKGVPAIDFAPGIRAFDQELMKYYHQAEDETASLDFNYLIRFFRAYAYAADLLANTPQAPTWTKGDKYEEAGKKLRKQ